MKSSHEKERDSTQPPAVIVSLQKPLSTRINPGKAVIINVNKAAAKLYLSQIQATAPFHAYWMITKRYIILGILN